VGVLEPLGGGPSLAITSADGSAWQPLGPLPIDAGVTARLVGTRAGLALAADGGEAGGPIAAWHSADGGATWTATLDGWRTVDLSSVTGAGATIVVAGRVRHRGRRPASTAWLTVSRDGGRTWTVQEPPNGHGEGACTTTVSIGRSALVATVGLCDGHQVWRAPADGATR
jgi:hypothetical protein